MNRFHVLSAVNLEGEIQGQTGSLLLVRFHLWGSWPLTEATLVRLRVIDPQGNPVSIRIRVRSCQPLGEQWMLQYDFAEEPSGEVLHLLGYTSA
jgi:hypothetical protein